MQTIRQADKTCWQAGAGSSCVHGGVAVQRMYAGHVWEVAYEVEEGGDYGEEVRRYRAGKAPRQIVEAEA